MGLQNLPTEEEVKTLQGKRTAEMQRKIAAERQVSMARQRSFLQIKWRRKNFASIFSDTTVTEAPAFRLSATCGYRFSFCALFF